MARGKKKATPPGLLDDFRAASRAENQPAAPAREPKPARRLGPKPEPARSQPDAPSQAARPAAKPVTERPRRQSRRDEPRRAPRVLPSWVFYLVLVVVTLGAWATIGAGYPVLGHGWRLVEAGGGSVAVAVGLWWLWDRRETPSSRGLLISGAASLLLSALFVVGSVHSVVLGGKVYAATSKTAQVWIFSHQLLRDFDKLAAYDKLLGYSQVDAQAHFSEYQPAQTDLQNLVNELGAINLGQLPDPGLITVVNDLKSAANYGADGLGAKYQLLQVTTDAQLTAQVESDRGTMDSMTISAWQALTPVTQRYGFSLVGQVHE